MSEIDEIFDWLDDPKSKRQPADIRRGTVGLVEYLVQAFAVADADQRERMRSSVKSKFSDVFFLYAGKMAVDAVRKTDPQLLVFGVFSLAIENLTFDWRESMIHLAAINHSATKLDLEPNSIFRSVQPMASDKFSNFLGDFMNRSSEEREIGIFGLRESQGLLFDYQHILRDPVPKGRGSFWRGLWLGREK